MNVIFVKFGTKYDADDVNRLAYALKDIGPMYCYTDDPTDVGIECIPPIRKLNGVWNKLAMFSRDFPVQGEILYVDLDTEVNFVPELFSPGPDLWLIHNPNKTALINEANLDVDINSSVMLFDNRQSCINEIWDHFTKSGLLDYFLRKYVGIDRYIYHEEFETKAHELCRSWLNDEIHNDRPFLTYDNAYAEYLHSCVNCH